MKTIKKMSKMRKALLSMLTLICGVMMFTVFQSNTFKEESKKVFQYVEEESYSYQSLCGDKLTQQEMAITQPFKMKRRVTKTVNAKNEISTVIENLIPSKGSRDLQNRVQRVVIDKSGIKMYDSKGSLIRTNSKTEKRSTEEYVIKESDLKLFGFYPNVELKDKNEIAILMKEKIKVVEMTRGVQKVIGEDIESILDTNTNTISHVMTEKGKTVFSSFNSFVKVNEENSILVRSAENTSSDILGEKEMVLRKILKRDNITLDFNGKNVVNYSRKK